MVENKVRPRLFIPHFHEMFAFGENEGKDEREKLKAITEKLEREKVDQICVSAKIL